MNRADKRRQEKMAKRSAKLEQDKKRPRLEPPVKGASEISQAIRAAMQYHLNGNLSEAEKIYQQIIKIQPTHPEALHFSGVIALQVGDHVSAIEKIRKAVAEEPEYADAHNNLGQAYEALGKYQEAVNSYHKAIAITPDSASVHNNLGNALKERGEVKGALASYRKAITLQPDFPEAHVNMGNVLKDQWEFEAAVESYRNAISIKPDFVEALSGLAYALFELGDINEAISRYREAIVLQPDDPDLYGFMGIALHMQGNQKLAIEAYETGYLKRRANKPKQINGEPGCLTTKSKLAHDIEQFEYLAAKGIDTEKYNKLAEAYRNVFEQINWPELGSARVKLSEKQFEPLRDTYNRNVNRISAKYIEGSTLNNALDVEKITSDYYAHEYGMTYFDDFLNSEALASLRRFLLESTIWFDSKYEGGYLGAMLRDGLACPLLLQIADDLRSTFPNVFKNHKLRQLWAYKYDSQLTGIRAHADFAAVNVNFWITPDAANLNPNSGGLVVYNVKAPPEWNFKTYNTDKLRIKNHIDSNNAGKLVVPHRQNRIVMFNSDLFHETDKIEFKSGYENRRINITMLFGHRGDHGV